MHNASETEIPKSNLNIFGSCYPKYEKENSNDEVTTSEQPVKEENFTNEKNNSNHNASNSMSASTNIPSSNILSTNVLNSSILSSNSNKIEGEHDPLMESEQNYDSNKSPYKSAKLFYDNSIPFETGTISNKSLLDKNYFSIAQASIFPKEGFLGASRKNSSMNARSAKSRKSSKNKHNSYDKNYCSENNSYMNCQGKISKFLEPFRSVDGSNDYDTFDIFGINKPRSSQRHTSVGAARKTEKGTPTKEKDKKTSGVAPATTEDAQHHQEKEDDSLSNGLKGEGEVQHESKAGSGHRKVECDPVSDPCAGSRGEHMVDHASNHASNHVGDSVADETGDHSGQLDEVNQKNPTETHTGEKDPYDEKKFSYDKFRLKNFFSKISKFITNSNEEGGEGEKYESKEMGKEDDHLSVPFSRRCGGLHSYSSSYELNEYFENKERKSETENLRNSLERFDTWGPIPPSEEKNKYEMNNEISNRCNRGESHKNDDVGTSELADRSETNEHANVQTENSENRAEENKSDYNPVKCYHHVRNTDQQNDDSLSDLGGREITEGKCQACANGEEQSYVMHVDNQQMGRGEVKEGVNNAASRMGYHRSEYQNIGHMSLSDLKHFRSMSCSGEQDGFEFFRNKDNLHEYYSILQKLPKRETKKSAALSSARLSDENNDGVNSQGNDQGSIDAINSDDGSANDAHEKDENGEGDADRGGRCRTSKRAQNSAERTKSNSDVESYFAHNPDGVKDDTWLNNNCYPQYSNSKYAYSKSKHKSSAYSRVRSQKRNLFNYSFTNSSIFNKDSTNVQRSDQEDEGNGANVDANVEADADVDANVDSYADCSEECGGEDARGGDVTTCIKPFGRVQDSDSDHNNVSSSPTEDMRTTFNPYVLEHSFKKEVYKKQCSGVCNVNSNYETFDIGIFDGDKKMLIYSKDKVIQDNMPDEECAFCASDAHKGGKDKSAQSSWTKRESGSDVDGGQVEEHMHEGYDEDRHHDHDQEDSRDDRHDDMLFTADPYGWTRGGNNEAPPGNKYNLFNNSNAFECNQGICEESCFQENCCLGDTCQRGNCQNDGCRDDCCRGNCAPDKYHMWYNEHAVTRNFSDGGKKNVERYVTNVRSDKRATYSNPFNLNNTIAYNLYHRGSKNYFPKNHYDVIGKENCAKHVVKNYFDIRIKEGRSDENKPAMLAEQKKSHSRGTYVSLPNSNLMNGQKCSSPNDVYYYSNKKKPEGNLFITDMYEEVDYCSRGMGDGGAVNHVGGGMVGRLAIDSGPAGGITSTIMRAASSSAGNGTTGVTPGAAMTFYSSPVNVEDCWMKGQKMSVSSSKIEFVRKVDMNYKRKFIDTPPTNESNKYTQYHDSNGLGLPSSSYYHDSFAKCNGLYDHSADGRSLKMPSQTNNLMPVDQNDFSNIRTKIPAEKTHANVSSYVIDVEELQENKYRMYEQLNMSNEDRTNVNNFVDLDNVQRNNYDVYRQSDASGANVVDYDWKKENFLKKKSALLNLYNDMEEDTTVNPFFPCEKKRDQMVDHIIDVDKVYEDDKYMTLPYESAKRRHMGTTMEGANAFRSGSMNVAQMERRRDERKLIPMRECKRELLQQRHQHQEEKLLHSGNYKLTMGKYNKNLLLNSPMDMSSVNNYPSSREYIMNAKGGGGYPVGNYPPNGQMLNGSGTSKMGRDGGRRSLFYNKYPFGRGSHGDEYENEVVGTSGGGVVSRRGGDHRYDNETHEYYLDDHHGRNQYRSYYNDNSRKTKLSKLCRDQRLLFSRHNSAAMSRKIPHAGMFHRGGKKSYQLGEDEESDYYMYKKYGFKKKKKKKKKHHLHGRRRGRDYYSHHRSTLNEDTLCNENELQKITQIESIISRKMKLSKIKREAGNNNLANPDEEDEDSDLYSNIDFDRIKIENILDGTIKLDNKDENIINNILELERRKYTINCIMDKLRKRENEYNYIPDMDRDFKRRINSNVYDLYSDKTTYNIYNTKMCVNYFLEEKMHSPENKEFIKNFFVEKSTKNVYFVQVFKKKKRKKEGVPVGKNCPGEEKTGELGEQVGNAGSMAEEASSSIVPPVQLLTPYTVAVGEESAAANEKKYVEEDTEGKLAQVDKLGGTDGEVPGEASAQTTDLAEPGEENGGVRDPPKSERKMNYFNYQLSFIKWKFYGADKEESKKEDAQQQLEEQAELLTPMPAHPPMESRENEKMEMADESFEFSMGKFVGRNEQTEADKIESEEKEANVVAKEGARQESLHGKLQQHIFHTGSEEPSAEEIHPISRAQVPKNTHPNEDETEDDFEEGDNLIDQMIGISKHDRDEEEEEKKRETENSFDSVINEEMVENEESKFENFPLQQQLFSAMKMSEAQIIMGDDDEEDLDEYDDDDSDEEDEEEEEESEDEADVEEEEEETIGDTAVSENGTDKEENNEANEVNNVNDVNDVNDMNDVKDENTPEGDKVEPVKQEAPSAEETEISEADAAHAGKPPCEGGEVKVMNECNGEKEEEETTSQKKEVLNLQNGETTTPHCSDDGNDTKAVRVRNESNENIKEERIGIIEKEPNEDKSYSDVKLMEKDKNEEEEEFEEVIEKRSCTEYRSKHNNSSNNNNGENYSPCDQRDNAKKEDENYAQHSNHGMINEITLKEEERATGELYSYLENGEKKEVEEESPEYGQFKKQIAMMDGSMNNKEKEDEKEVKEKNEQEEQQKDDNNLPAQKEQLTNGTISAENSNNSFSNMTGKNLFTKDMVHENNQYVHEYCDIEDSVKYEMMDEAKKNRIDKIKKKIKKNKKLTKEDYKLLSELLHHKFVLNEIRTVGNYEVNYKNCFDILELEEYKLRKDMLKMHCECLSIGLTTHEREFLNEFKLFMPDINIMDDMNILYILRHSKNEKNCVFKCLLGEKESS
ncbi:Uncharacterized protein PCOAH_00018180 [Plasmodium coatneyi]|uniref:Uncharacterized protein n=1 Tax=Plasmodium coatneyi TaxID=208452 RepID=A0A1B1DXE8_9APIC|nr:Uncharacterized protein PCOAH_00018180 [Plasmodium coatneyi]ANQ07453.1 Uncharacterized protein PCOAH_00018180 [Plasmodium coatneyi]